MAEEKTLAAALNEVTDAEVETAAEKIEADDEAAESAEPDADGDAPDPVEKEDDDKEGDEEDAESEGESDEEDSDDAEASDEDDEEEDDDSTPFDKLTPEQLKAIKANPDTSKLYKALMRSYSEKTSANKEAIKLAEAFKKDPDKVLEAISRVRGYELKKSGGAAATETAKQQTALEMAGKKLEELFGKEAGPKVREIFEEWGGALVADKISPFDKTLGHVVNQNEMARMSSEESAWRARHEDILTPEIEKEVLKLGESGKYIPGEEMTPAEYLDNLTDLVLAKQKRNDSSRRLAHRINKNKREEEPVRGVSAKSGVKPLTKIKPTMRIGDAFDQAWRELEEEGA